MIANSCIILTGSTGLLGSQLLSFFIEKGFSIVCPVRNKSKDLPYYHNPKCKYLSYPELFRSNGDAYDSTNIILIHCAGLVSYKKRDKASLYDINYGLTDKIAGWALQANVLKMIYISSISALSKNRKSYLIDETTFNDTGIFNTNYGKSKRAGEECIKDYGKRGLNWIILNPSVILGPAPLQKSSATLFKYIKDKKPFYTKGIINFIDVRDVTEIIYCLIISDTKNEQFILNGGVASYRDFFRSIAKRMNLEAPFIKIPKFLVLTGAVLEFIFSKLNGNEPTLSIETAKMAGKNYIYNSKKIKSHLNYSFKSLNDSIQFTVNEMNKKGYL